MTQENTSLMARLRADQVAARFAGDAVAAGLLTALVAEAARVGKDKRNGETTDEEAVAVVRKFIGGAEETRAILASKGDARAEKAQAEIAILTACMPAQMEGEALEAAMRALAAELGLSGPKAMGELMKAMKERYAGRYDGGKASAFAKSVLAG